MNEFALNDEVAVIFAQFFCHLYIQAPNWMNDVAVRLFAPMYEKNYKNLMYHS